MFLDEGTNVCINAYVFFIWYDDDCGGDKQGTI